MGSLRELIKLVAVVVAISFCLPVACEGADNKGFLAGSSDNCSVVDLFLVVALFNKYVCLELKLFDVVEDGWEVCCELIKLVAVVVAILFCLRVACEGADNKGFLAGSSDNCSFEDLFL